jgi:hypothetical protein
VAYREDGKSEVREVLAIRTRCFGFCIAVYLWHGLNRLHLASS